MTMLQRGSIEYIKEAKELAMIEAVPITKTNDVFPSPRVLNTHLRLDVLPKEFRGRKTVWAKYLIDTMKEKHIQLKGA